MLRNTIWLLCLERLLKNTQTSIVIFAIIKLRSRCNVKIVEYIQKHNSK